MIDRSCKPGIKEFGKFETRLPEKRQLESGTELLTYHGGTEDVIRLDFMTEGGTNHQDKLLQARMTGRLLREGTSNMNSEEIARITDFYGATIGTTVTRDFSLISLICMRKHIANILPVVRDMLTSPAFPEHEIAQVGEANKESLRIEMDKVAWMSRRRFETALLGKDNTYARYALPSDFDVLTRDDLIRFYNKHYNSQSLHIYMTGRFTDNEVKLIESHFGRQRWGGTYHPAIQPPFIINPEEGGSWFVEKPGARQSSLDMGRTACPAHDKQYIDLKIATTVLGGYFGSRLMKTIREEKGYTYGIGARIQGYPEISILSVSTEASPENMDEVIAQTKLEMDRLRNEPLGREELNMVKNYMWSGICETLDGVFSLPDAWMYLKMKGLPSDWFEHYAGRVREITAQEIQAAAQKWFRHEEMKIVTAGRR